MRTIRPKRVLRKAHHRSTASAAPTKNSGFTCSADCTAGLSDQPPSGSDGSRGALGWMKGLPRKKASPVPNSIMAMPMAMSFTLRQLADIAVDGAEQRAGEPGGKHAQPGRAGEVGDGVAGHGAEDERAFEAEIDASRFLRQALAEADEEERRGDADGAREHGEQNDAEGGFAGHCVLSLLRKNLKRP